MSATHGKRVRLLSTLHLVAMMGVAIWWGAYFWRHTPARVVWDESPRARAATFGSPSETIERAFARLATTARLAGPDLLAGASTLLLFALGTGVYVRRVEIWLQARTSGQAVSFGAGDLEGQALLANNANQKRTP